MLITNGSNIQYMKVLRLDIAESGNRFEFELAMWVVIKNLSFLEAATSVCQLHTVMTLKRL